jgi:hypothetical protein
MVVHVISDGGGEIPMKRTIVVGVMLALGALVLACDKSSGGSTTETTSGGGGGSIGVKECDDYIAKWDTCYKDPAMKAAANPGLDQMKTAWAAAAKDPNSKAALGTGCKSALDALVASGACK